MTAEAMTPGDRLIGREREVAEAGAAVEAALAGDGSLVLLRGEAGIGKTRLLEALVTDVKGQGAAAVWATCWEGIGVPPFWPWVHVLRECESIVHPHGANRRAQASDLTSFLPDDELLTGAGSEAPAGELSEHLRLRLFDGVAMFLMQAATSRPLVLVIDDLQWADMSSLRLLRFLAGSLHRHRIALVGSHRYPDLSPNSPLAAELADLTRTAWTLTLYGLGRDAAHELIRQAVETDPSERLVASLHERASGNPLFIREIIQLLAAQGRLDVVAEGHAPFPMPLSVRKVIEQRLHHVGQPCREVLSRASVLGEEFRVEILQAIADQSTHQVAGLLDEGMRAGLLLSQSESTRRYRFSHGLIREALYADLPPRARAALHRQVGEVIEERFRHNLDERLGELAYHFLLSAGEDPSKALGYLQRAGDQALAMLAYEEAAGYFARALELVSPSDELAGGELLLRLGDARLRAGEWDGAVAAYEEAAGSARRGGDADLLARAALGLGAGFSGFEVPLFDQRQLDLLQEALDALGQEDSSLRARVLARLSVAASFVRSPDQRAESSREAIEVARRVGDRDALAYALSSYCDAIAGPDHTEERLTLATEMVGLGQQTSNREMELLGRRFRLVALLELGDVAAVDAEIDAFARVADALLMPLYRWYVPLWQGMRAIMEGRLADCEQLLARARAIGRQANSRNATVLTDAQHNLWLMESGRADEACRRMERYLDDPDRGPNVAGALVSLLVRTGQRARASALLSRMAAEGFERVELEDTFSLAALCLAAEGAADLGEREAATQLYRRLSPYSRRFGISGIANSCLGSVSRYLGQLAHVLAWWEVAEGHFRDALDDHRRAGATLLIAHTLRDRAAMVFDRDASGDRDAATADLEEAIAVYRELGLQSWGDRSEGARPREAGARAPRPPNTFRLEGDIWTIVYGGSEARLKDAKGLQVIARLLASPGKEFHVLDLLAPTGTPDSRPPERDETLAEPGDVGEVVDAQARRQYKERVTALEQELEEAEANADAAKVERMRAERDFLIAELSATYGLAGRVRRAHDPAERARWTVTKRVHTTLRNLNRLHPPLAQHLQNSIKTGYFCSYSPERETPWAL